MKGLEVSIEWESERREDRIYRALENVRSSLIGTCLSVFGDEDIDKEIRNPLDEDNYDIIFENEIIPNLRDEPSNLSVEGTIGACQKRRYYFVIPPDLIEYIKSEIPTASALEYYEDNFPNNAYIFDEGKKYFEMIMKLGFSEQAAFAICGACWTECGWNCNVYNADEVAGIPGSATMAQGWSGCGEGLFGLTGWQTKYKIIKALSLDKRATVYGINKQGYLDRKSFAAVSKIAFKSDDIDKMKEEYDNGPSNESPHLFMCDEKTWVKILEEFIKGIPRVASDDRNMIDYFKYEGVPMNSTDSEDIDHKILYASYLFKAAPGTPKTFDDVVKIVEKYKSTHSEMYSPYNPDYKTKNGFVQQLLVAYLLSQYVNDVQVEDISLEDIFGSFGQLPSMNANFLVNTYVGLNVTPPLILPKPNAEGITAICHTDNMWRRPSTIQYIILHYTAGSSSQPGAAVRTVKTLDTRKLSSDYVVDDNTIIQFADDPAKWASTAVQKWDSRGTEAGRLANNGNAVSIEICSTLRPGADWKHPNHDGWSFTEATLNNALYLCRKLVTTYKIPKEHIIRHYDIMGKCCPGIIGWNLGPGSNNENKYREFVETIYSGLDPNSTKNEPSPFKLFTAGWIPYDKENKTGGKIT